MLKIAPATYEICPKYYLILRISLRYDDSAKAALANELFGRGGNELIPMLIASTRA